MSNTFSNIASLKVDDLEGMWNYKSDYEQYKLFELLYNWKVKKEGRDVILLGGDVHIGG